MTTQRIRVLHEEHELQLEVVGKMEEKVSVPVGTRVKRRTRKVHEKRRKKI